MGAKGISCACRFASFSAARPASDFLNAAFRKCKLLSCPCLPSICAMRMIRLFWQRESFVCDKHADGVKAGSHERLADESASGGAWAFFAPLAGRGAGGAGAARATGLRIHRAAGQAVGGRARQGGQRTGAAYGGADAQSLRHAAGRRRRRAGRRPDPQTFQAALLVRRQPENGR